MDPWGSTRSLGDIDVLARLREHVSRLDLGRAPVAPSDVDALQVSSREAEEIREFEEGILAEAIIQSKQEALASASQGATRRFQIIAIGYTRAGECDMCSPDDRHCKSSQQTVRGAWKAAVPLFRFMVIQTNSFGEELDRCCITKSREDFESLHEHLQIETRAIQGSGEVWYFGHSSEKPNQFLRPWFRAVLLCERRDTPDTHFVA